jgi:hypothetical protein
MNLPDQIIADLKKQFRFKSDKGNWLQQGQCPQCDKWEAFCAAEDPKVVKCGRFSCGWEDSVRNLLPDLFEDWTRRAPPTDVNPTATVDAYLSVERGLDLAALKGLYTQEYYRDHESGHGSTTVRFQLENNSYWERIIDRPGRFKRKANFKYGSNWSGWWWAPPEVSYDKLALASDIWFAEGIFDAQSLRQAGLDAVSLMSINNYPEHALGLLRKAVADGKRPNSPPRLVFAFDVGAPAVSATRKYVERARREGWDVTAAQVRPDGEGTKLDWNDLWLRHAKWRGAPEGAPFSPEKVDEYLWNGAVTIAKTPRDKAKLIRDGKGLANFDFRHGNRLFWAKTTYDEDQKPELLVTEIANCAFRILYREWEEVLDEANYFIQIDFPDGVKSEKRRFSNSACTNSAEFKKRLFAFRGMWSGTGEQLDRLMRRQTKKIKTVEPIAFTGYSAPHRAWVLGDLAVRDGRVIEVNNENYFDLGKSAVKLKTPERILDIDWQPDKLKFDWVPLVWEAWGPRGMVALAFFTLSLFAVQIREKHKSIGFLEITGQPGSGKTTLVELMWKMLGRSGYEGFDPNKGTVSGVTRNLLKVSNMPVGLIEGNREDGKGHQRRFDWQELLTLYNGRSPRVLGTRNGGSETYEPPFLATIYLMQNERIDATPAVLERLMSMKIDKAEWSPATRDAAIKLESWPVESMSGSIIHILRNEAAFLEFYFRRYQHHESGMRERVRGLHNSRCIKTHSQLAAAVDALKYLFPVQDAWLAKTVGFVDAMALDRQDSCGGDHPLVADFWEKVDYLISGEGPNDHAEGSSINQSRSPDRVMAVSLSYFETRARNAGISPVNMMELKRLLRSSKSRKFIAQKQVNSPSGRNAHCWVFEQPGQPATSNQSSEREMA